MSYEKPEIVTKQAKELPNQSEQAPEGNLEKDLEKLKSAEIENRNLKHLFKTKVDRLLNLGYTLGIIISLLAVALGDRAKAEEIINQTDSSGIAAEAGKEAESERVILEKRQVELKAALELGIFQQLNQPFSEEETMLLKKKQESDDYIDIVYFKDGKITGSEISMADLQKMGKLKFSQQVAHIISSEGDLLFSTTINGLTKIFEKNKKPNLDVIYKLEGLGELNIGQAALPENMGHQFVGPYHFYDLKQSNQDSAFAEYQNIDELAKGAAIIEEDFGFKSGQKVKRIVADRQHPGTSGYYEPLVDTLRIGIDATKITQARDLSLISRHEAAHLFDDIYKISSTSYRDGYFFHHDSSGNKDSVWTEPESESMTRYQEFFNKADKYSVNWMAEVHFYKYNDGVVGHYGHPTDNIKEFFASTINSLYISNPQERFSGLSPIFLNCYRDCLEATLTRIRDIPELKSAPIIEKIQKRINLVERISRKNEAAEAQKSTKDFLAEKYPRNNK